MGAVGVRCGSVSLDPASVVNPSPPSQLRLRPDNRMTQRMRVDHVVTAFPRDKDDVITPWMVELLRSSRERGTDARVLAPAYRGLGDHRIRGIPVRRFRYAPARWERLSHEETVPERVRRRPVWSLLVPPYLAAGTAAAWRLGREAPDVVHVHWPFPHALFGAAARAASGGRTALVCSFYAVGLNWVDRRMPWLRPLLRWSARTADAVTANSSQTARLVRRITGREAEVIPSAAARRMEEAGERREPLTAEGPLRLLFVGRLVERKGVEYLVRALPRILSEREVELTVVGEGEWEREIRSAARECGVEDRVTLTGFVPARQLARLYAGCDVFVLPAVVDRKGDTEGLGVVLLEALTFGRPVVASALGGIPDIVKDGATGWLVPPEDPGVLADQILQLAAHPEEARRVAEEGRRHAQRNFSVDRIVSRLHDCYRRAAARRTGGSAGAGGRGQDPGGER